MDTAVVNVRFEEFDVYVGRGRCPRTGQMSRWGNPYSHRAGTAARFSVATVEDAIEAYRRWLWEQLRTGAITRTELAELHGKRLGCWCAPRPCHGEVLAAAAAWAAQA